MSDARHVARQRRFYETGEHAHLRAREDDLYARHIALRLADAVGIGEEHRVLEVGASFGRFSFPLLERCASLVALDLSSRALEELARARDARGIPQERCRTLHLDVDALAERPGDERFDRIAGFFFLHHVPDFARTLRTLAARLAPGGALAFVEPNRWNPLFALQIACCADMRWREEKGLYRLGRGNLEAACRDAGLVDVRSQRFGFFPPQLFNPFASARRLEARLEAALPLRGVLPFLLVAARRP